MTRLVLDTNVVVSAVCWGGKPRLLLEAAEQGRVELFTSSALLAELREVVSQPKFGSKVAAMRRSPGEIVGDYAKRAKEVVPERTSRITADPDDDVVIGTALAAQAGSIVSGDAHLLNLKSYGSISIYSVAQATALLGLR